MALFGRDRRVGECLLLREERKSGLRGPISVLVKVFGCRPMMTAPRTPGPASANLQGRKPREVGRSSASDAMGFSALVICCPRALSSSLGSGRGGELSWPIATGSTGVAQQRLIDEAVVQGGATASKAVADREPAQQKFSSGMSRRTYSDHDVSILITAVDAAGR